jgi:hypothetical protein
VLPGVTKTASGVYKASCYLLQCLLLKQSVHLSISGLCHTFTTQHRQSCGTWGCTDHSLLYCWLYIARSCVLQLT